MRTIAWPRLSAARSDRVGSRALDFSDCTSLPPFQPNSRRCGGTQVFYRQLIAATLGDDAAAIEHEGAMAHLRDLFEIRRHDEDRGASFECNVEQAIDLRLRADVDTGGRIFEDIHAPGKVQPSTDDDLLLISARQPV